MLPLRATRFARALFGGCQRLAALHVLCVMALVAGCHSSSGSYLPPTAQLTSIAVGPPDSTVAMGLSSQFTATGLYSDGSKKDISSQVTWSSANAAAAWISNTGMATTASPGSTTITAKMARMSGSTSLNVTAATLVVIDLTPTNASLANGLTGHFVATGVYTDNSVHDITASVTWSSSVNTVAAISNTPGSNGMTTTASPGVDDDLRDSRRRIRIHTADRDLSDVGVDRGHADESEHRQRFERSTPSDRYLYRSFDA